MVGQRPTREDAGAAALTALQRAVSRDLGTRYDVGAYLGQGAFATVWKVRDRVTGEDLAVKRLDGRLGQAHTFYRELSAMLRLVHPRAVRLVNLLEADRARYLLLEFCAGGTLRDALQPGCVCPPGRVSVLARQLAEGLAFAHRRGLVHRDLKPENVLFATADPRPYGGTAAVKLADFGLARALQQSARAEAAGGALGGLSGTPIYMAPEQFRGSYGPATDLYALGVLLYELLHGQPPFSGRPEQLASAHLQALPVFAARLPNPWPQLLTALLSKNPADRPSAEALLALLQDASGEQVSLPRLSGSPSYQPLPAETFGVFSRPNGEFVAVAPGQLLFCSPSVAPTRPALALPGLTGAVQGLDGILWLLRGQHVARLDKDGQLEEVLQLPSGCDTLASCGEERLAVVSGPTLTELRRDGRAYLPSWSASLRSYGLQPRLARTATGELLVAEGPSCPALVVLDAEGRARQRYPLPGPCWDLQPWPGSNGWLVSAVVRNGLEAFRLDEATGALVPLTSSHELACLGQLPAGGMCGITQTGAVHCWPAPAQLSVAGQLEPGRGVPKGCAASASHLAVLLRAGTACRLVIQPFAGAE